MTMITRWEPFRELANLQERVGRALQTENRNHEELLSSGAFLPPVDIYEDDHHVTLKLEVPGVKQDDIDIRVENNNLTIRGERKLEKDEKEENFRRVERSYGSFFRSFTLPSTVTTENVEAECEHGILTIQFAKRPEAKPRQIKVSLGKKAIEGTSTEQKGTESPRKEKNSAA